MNSPWILTLLGIAVGTFGTLVGAGGGFILMPLFFFIYPDKPADHLTAISLAVVFFNAASGTIAYVLKQRVDFKSGSLFAAASVPGAMLGAFTTSFLSRNIFDPIFAGLLILVGTYLVFKPSRMKNGASAKTALFNKHRPGRILIERNGTQHYLSFHSGLGIGISVVVGFLSSLLGIGGGIIHVPALVHFLRFPVHIATATSHFILAIMALCGTLVHLLNGSLSGEGLKIAWLALGVIGGAQLGAKLSDRVQGNWIIRGLAFALVLVGLRLILVPIEKT